MELVASKINVSMNCWLGYINMKLLCCPSRTKHRFRLLENNKRLFQGSAIQSMVYLTDFDILQMTMPIHVFYKPNPDSRFP